MQGQSPQYGNMAIGWGSGGEAPGLGRFLVQMVMYVDFLGMAGVIMDLISEG